MKKTRREQKREETEQAIKATAKEQMAEVGAAALSLRAIARAMGMTAPAIYRYFPDRDALVTALIVDAYTDLGDALVAASNSLAADDFYGRFRAIALTYRTWAMAHPQPFRLIYGTPIPGYKAPRDKTVPPAARVQQTFGQMLGEAIQAGAIEVAEPYVPTSKYLLEAVETALAYMPVRVPPVFITLTMSVWARLQGIIWGELNGHFLPGIEEHGELFEMELYAICHELGLQPKNE